MKFQNTSDSKFILTIAPFPAAEDGAINTALNVDRNRYYRTTLSQVFGFVGIANMLSSYDKLAIETLRMLTRCGMCKDGEAHTYGIIGSPDVCVVAICEKCYHDYSHQKWILFPPVNS